MINSLHKNVKTAVAGMVLVIDTHQQNLNGTERNFGGRAKIINC